MSEITRRENLCFSNSAVYVSIEKSGFQHKDSQTFSLKYANDCFFSGENAEKCADERIWRNTLTKEESASGVEENV